MGTTFPKIFRSAALFLCLCLVCLMIWCLRAQGISFGPICLRERWFSVPRISRLFFFYTFTRSPQHHRFFHTIYIKYFIYTKRARITYGDLTRILICFIAFYWICAYVCAAGEFVLCSGVFFFFRMLNVCDVWTSGQLKCNSMIGTENRLLLKSDVVYFREK